MMIRKTPMDKRESYTYEYESVDKNGNRVVVKEVLRPKREGNEKDQEDENRVPPEFIKELHRLDDNEVNNNCRNWHPKLTETQQQNKKDWEKAHPGEKYPMPYTYSYDYIKSESDNGDISKSHVLASASYDPFEDDAPYEVLKLREIINTKMTENQRTALILIEYEGYTGKEAADIMGISHSMATRHHRNAMKCIRKNF